MIRTFFTLVLIVFAVHAQTQDLCPDAYDLGTLVCGDVFSEVADAGNTADPEAMFCMTGLEGTWFTFNTSDALYEFTISGTDYNLFEGSCGSLNYIDGCGNNIVVPGDATTQYFVLVNGDFTIDTPSEPANDNCGGAIDVTGGATNLDNFCSDTDIGICGSDGNASVWFEYDVSQDLLALEISVSGAITDPVIGFYLDCSTQLLEECSGSTIVECLTAGTYFIQIGSDYENTGTFDLSFVETVSTASNDNCEDAEDVTPSETCVVTNISGDSSGACPESTNFGSGCDFDVNETVWFEFTTTSSTVSVDLLNLSSNLELLVMEGSCSGPVYPCVTADASLMVNGSETYFITASLTTGGGSFDFDIIMNEPPSNDACDDAGDLDFGPFNTCCGAIEGIDQCGGSETGVWFEYFLDGDGTMYTFTNIDMSGSIGIEIYEGDCGGLLLLNEPYCGGPGSYEFEVANCGATTHFIHVTSSSGGCGSFELSATPFVGCSFGEDCGDGETLSPSTGSGEVCATGCNAFACDSDCSTNGVWFMVETDDLATEMSVIVSDVGGSNIDPIVTILQADCSGGALVACENVASGDIIETAVSGNQMYFIEVSSGGSGDPGDFEICVLTDESQVECSDGGLEPSRPEYPDADPYGPYCPGEVVNFCYDVTFTVDPIGQGNNCQWIQGIIPTIGGGWDLEAMPLDAQGPGGSWFWLDEEEVEYNAPTSILGIINTPYGLGLEYGPGTLTMGDQLPGGWWSVSDGGGCANDGNPNTMWGLPASCGSSQDVSFCFDLKVGELDDIADCADMDVTDLKVHIFTMADGQTGCWSNNSCSGDQPVTFNAILDCTSLVFIEAEDAEICSNGVLNIPVMTEDGSDVDIVVEVVDEGNTTGASDWEFQGGSGVIADMIENEGSDVEIVIYEAYAVNPASICEGPRTEIEVVVYPDILIEVEEPYYICYQQPIEIEPLVSGGNGGPYDFMWEDGSTGSTIELPLDPDLLPGEYEIQLMVTDEFGCSKEIVVEYEIVEPLYPEIINPYIGVCKDGVEDLPELFIEFESAGTGPYEFLWESSPGGLEFENGDNDENLIINEEESSSRTYTIYGTVIDDYGCEYTTETELTVDNGPDLELEVDECLGTAFVLSGYDGDGLLVNFQLFYDSEGDWIYDGTTIQNAELVLEQFGDNISYLAEEYGTYLLLGVSTNGCSDYEELELPPVALPEFVIAPNDTICAGTEITVSVSNSNEYVDYNWSNGEDGSSFVATPLMTTTYYLVAETPDDCEVVDSVTVVVNPLPQLSVTGSTAICPGTQTSLTATGNPDFSYLWSGPNGEMITTQSAVISAPGTWELMVVSTTGCMNTLDIEIDENAQLNPEISGGNLCTGQTVTLDGGPGFDGYEWLDGSMAVIGTTQTVDVSTGGEYILNVVLGAGMGACEGSDTFTVQQFDPLTDILNASNTELCNIDNGGLSTIVDLTAFENGVNGQWVNNNNLPVADPSSVDFDGVLPGTYRYTFRTMAATAPCTDRNVPFDIVVLDCSCPSVAISRPPDFCATADTFNLNLIRITSEPGDWSINPSTIAIENNQVIINEATPAGSYDLTYTLSDPDLLPECQRDSTVRLQVFARLTAEFLQDVEVCNEDTGNGPDFIDLDDLIIDADPGEWSTNEVGLVIDSDNVVSFAGLDVGSYRFFYYMEDPLSACPPVTRTVDVDVIDCSCPQFDILPLNDLCTTGGSMILSNFIDNPDNVPGTWSVTGPDATVLIGGTIFSGDRIPGLYTLSFTLTNPQGGSCQNTVSEDFEILAPPEAEVTPEVFACNGTNITVYPTTLNFNDFVIGSSGVWSAPPDFKGGVIADISSVDFIDVVPGVYSFEYTTDDAMVPCENVSYTMNVTVRNCNCPTVAFVTPVPLCNDGPDVDLNDYLPTDAPDGVWSFVNGSPEIDLTATTVFSLSQLEGFYLFQYTLDEVPEGCPDFGQISIEVVSPPEVVHRPTDNVCNVESSIDENCIDLTTYVTGVPGSWSADPDYDGDFSVLSNICFDQEDPGEELSFVFTTETGSVTCDERSYTTVFTVLNCNCPNLTVTDPTGVCSLEGNIDLSDYEDPNIVGGSWSFVDGPVVLSLSGTVVDVTDAETGNYTFRYTPEVTPNSDCPQFSEITLFVEAYFNVGEFNGYTYCVESGTQVALDQFLIGEDLEGGFWYVDGMNVGSGLLGDVIWDVTGYQSGIHTITYEYVAISTICPPASVEFELVVGPDLQAEISDSPCADMNQGSIIVSSIDTGMELLYSIDGGETWTSESEFMNLAPGMYDVLVEDEFGCQWSIPGLEVDEPEELSVYAGEDRQVEEGPGFINLMISSNIDLNSIESVVWTVNGTIVCSGSPDQCASIDVNPDGVAECCVVITDFNGCVSEDCVFLRERIVKDVYIANIFSADQDLGESSFYIQGDQYVSEVNEFRIYDRWGNLVFEAPENHLPNDRDFGWDGTMNGGYVEQGVYVYFVKVTYTDNETEIFTGDVTFLRD